MKPILLFGAPGASDAIEDLTKAHVDGYTRKDGTVVQSHETSRQASAAPVTRSENEGYGFHNAAYNSHRREKYGIDNDVPNGKGKEAQDAASGAFSRVAHDLVSAGHFDKHEHARDFLDSTHGRHLGDEIGHKGSIKDVKWLPKSVSKFKASAGIPMKKAVLLFGDGIGDLAKAHVKGYTRKDGTFVNDHDSGRSAAKPKTSKSSVEVQGADRYEFTNGKKPSGRGSWIFSPHKSIDPSVHKEGEHYFQSAPHTPYADAKKQAKEWAASKGHSTIHVQT